MTRPIAQPDQLEFDEEIGLPHSEICGSKVAHTSPQLIAACHVLHRLCMPRHPPNALTSRLKTRTTNDNTDVSSQHVAAIKRFLLFPSYRRYSREVLRSALPIPFPRHRSKKTHSQCQRLTIGQMPKARYRRRNVCDGKLVAYILEG